jgi:hypothetical protein
MDPIYPSGVSNPRGEGQLVKVISRLCLGLLQLEHHLLEKAVEVLILLFNHDLACHRSIHRGLALLQLLEILVMPFLELPQILLEDGMILLELSVLGL